MIRFIEQGWEWKKKPTIDDLKLIEEAGRVCYKSEEKITDESYKKFIGNIIAKGHLSVIEHINVSVKFITNRRVTHELVRHRLCSFSQTSQRYVNYLKKGIQIIKPVWFKSSLTTLNSLQTNLLSYEEGLYLNSVIKSVNTYNELVCRNWKPEEAGDLLPNCVATEIMMSCNLRELRHIFELRTSPQAHPQMRQLMISLLKECKKEIPIIFDDILLEE